MEFNLPNSALVNRFIPKNKFFEKAIVNTKLKNEFTDKIKRITWKYKLAEKSIGIPATKSVEEIQVFEIELKQKSIPQNVLKLINKTIPYPILYIFTYGEEFLYGIALKQDKGFEYYFSEWNEPIDFDFSGHNMEKVYQNTIKHFIKKTDTGGKDFQQIVATDKEIKQLEKEINTLKKKIKKEKQFNKKVEFNTQLLKKKKRLNELLTHG
jgi:hypothetical protein